MELIDADGKRLAVAHGSDNEVMQEVVWPLTSRRPTEYRIRIFDNAKGPWGHINVGNVRCE